MDLNATKQNFVGAFTRARARVRQAVNNVSSNFSNPSFDDSSQSSSSANLSSLDEVNDTTSPEHTPKMLDPRLVNITITRTPGLSHSGTPSVAPNANLPSAIIPGTIMTNQTGQPSWDSQLEFASMYQTDSLSPVTSMGSRPDARNLLTSLDNSAGGATEQITTTAEMHSVPDTTQPDITADTTPAAVNTPVAVTTPTDQQGTTDNSPTAESPGSIDTPESAETIQHQVLARFKRIEQQLQTKEIQLREYARSLQDKTQELQEKERLQQEKDRQQKENELKQQQQVLVQGQQQVQDQELLQVGRSLKEYLTRLETRQLQQESLPKTNQPQGTNQSIPQ